MFINDSVALVSFRCSVARALKSGGPPYVAASARWVTRVAVRTRVLDDELEDISRGRYPGFRPPNSAQIQSLEARLPHFLVLSEVTD